MDPPTRTTVVEEQPELATTTSTRNQSFSAKSDDSQTASEYALFNFTLMNMWLGKIVDSFYIVSFGANFNLKQMRAKHFHT